MMQLTDYYCDMIKRYWQTYPGEQSWIKKARLDGHNSLEKSGIPNTANESWRYTNLEKLLNRQFTFSEVKHHSVELPTLPAEFDIILFCNGKLTKFPELGKGVKICSLLDVQDEEIIDFENDRSVISQDKASTYLCDAFLNNGVFISLEKDIKLKRPILILHFSDQVQEKSIQTTHSFIKLGENSSADIIEMFADQHSSQVFVSNSCYINLEKHSKLGHYLLQLQHHESVNVSNARTKVKAGAMYTNMALNLGAQTFRNNLHVELQEEEATAHVHGLYAIGKDQHSDTDSLIHHQAPRTYSQQLYKGIMSHNARGVFTGRVKIDKYAVLCEAKQLNKNLLMHKQSQINSRPQLEIFTDDVKCAHGSTTGQINQDQLFYFTSRGVTPERAKKLLTQGYANEVIMKIENKSIQDFYRFQLENDSLSLDK